MAIDDRKMELLLEKMVGDLGAAASGALVLIGDKLGLYKALVDAGPLTSSQLAQRTSTNERYVREWLAAQAASGYVTYDSASSAFSLTAEQAAVFADRESPFHMAGGYYSITSLYMDEPKITDAFRSGRGVAWHEHSECLFCGTERFFAPAYRTFLVDSWLPALDGVLDKLRKGATFADVGCGHGRSTLIMAQAFPQSKFFGFDYHAGSIDRARALAAEAGLPNIEFAVSDARNLPGSNYDVVACFDCLHDMGDPVGAAQCVRKVIAPDGTWMIVEPLAGDRLEENLNPQGRLFYSFSTMVCTPASMSQDVGLALGAQAGEARLRKVAEAGGFTRFRRATATQANMVLEARP